MDEKQYDKLEEVLHRFNAMENLNPTDAIALASIVLDYFVKSMPGNTSDDVVRKGITLQVLYYLDTLHAQARIIRDSRR